MNEKNERYIQQNKIGDSTGFFLNSQDKDTTYCALFHDSLFNADKYNGTRSKKAK